MSCFNLFILVLCLQIVSLKSCEWLVEQLLKELEDNNLDAAAKSIAMLSDCGGDFLENAAKSAREKGYGRRFLIAASKANRQSWGNVVVLEQTIAAASNASFAGESASPTWGIDHDKARSNNPPGTMDSVSSPIPYINRTEVSVATLSTATSVEGNDLQDFVDPAKGN